ncbi:MAG: radical SAM protein [Thermodesulfovibrio sp.]|nr:radical SAM protein [Thermodesulfovibrio sp.]
MKPVILLANNKGEIFESYEYEALGMERNSPISLSSKDLIPLPKGSKLFYIPNAIPIGLNHAGIVEKIANYRPVAAFLPPGYTRTHLPAFEKTKFTPKLPLWSYTAVAWYRGKIHAAAIRVAWMKKANPVYHEDKNVLKSIKRKNESFKNNRLFKQLEICAMIYNCFAAKNFFLNRWEAPLPTSPLCNAECIGCLSKQPSDCCPSQERISFVPEPREISEIAISHLLKAEEAIVSFGQGCEGEPLLQWKVIEKAIGMTREKTDRGIININTNGSLPKIIPKLKKAGLNSIRISLNSFNHEIYQSYYKPKGYKFEDVIKAIKISKECGLFTSLNYLIFPGYNDSEDEIEKLFDFLMQCSVDLIQMRNLSIDPYLYMEKVEPPKGRILGIRKLIKMIKKDFPHIKIGYFNLPKEAFNNVNFKEQCYFI